MKKYTRLDAIESEDIEKVREFCALKNELYLIETRRNYLREIMNDNDELREAVWTTQEGVAKPISDLDDDHLKNIVTHLANRGGSNARIRKEYTKRFGEAPALPTPSFDDEFDF